MRAARKRANFPLRVLLMRGLSRSGLTSLSLFCLLCDVMQSASDYYKFLLDFVLTAII